MSSRSRPTFSVLRGGDSPRRTCCERFADAEEQGFISLTTAGPVLSDTDGAILADISFCPFCGARWEIVN
jgi:hypothetical protein